MLDPESIQIIQSFSLSLAQNFIASLIVEAKKFKDDKNAAEAVSLLENHERSKPILNQIEQRICDGFRKLGLAQEKQKLLIPLASDQVFLSALARLILRDAYSPESVVTLIVEVLPTVMESDSDLLRIAKELIAAIQIAIAEVPFLSNLKSIQFQYQITERVDDVKTETVKTQEIARQTNSEVKEMKDLLLRYVPLPNTHVLAADQPSEMEIREKVYHEQIAAAREMMLSGKPKTAREILLGIRKDVLRQNASKSLLFRIATNIGACSFQIDDRDSAIREIETAFELDPDNPQAITNISLIALLKGDPQKALDVAAKARQMPAQKSVATANYVQALFALKRDSEVETLVANEDWIERDATCCLTIGTLLLERNRCPEAEHFLRSGLLADPKHPRIYVTLAHSILQPIQRLFQNSPMLNWKIPGETITRLKEAEVILGEAISLNRESEDRRWFAFAYILRADVRRFLGNESAAIADCETALHACPNESSVLPIKALVHINAGEYEKAVEAFEKIEDDETKERLRLQIAIAYNASSKPEKALAVVLPHWNPNLDEPAQIRIAEQMLWSYTLLNKSAEADNVISNLQRHWPNDPDSLMAIATYRCQQGKTEEAAGLLSVALGLAKGTSRDLVALQLAEIMYRKNEFSKAAELYETAADLTTNNDQSRKYLVCIYNSGMHSAALDLARRLRGPGNPLPVVSQIEANILGEIGDLKSAQEIMERLAELHPVTLAYKVAAAEFAMRRGETTDAKRLITSISFEEIRSDAKLLMRVGQMRAVLGLNDILKFLYQARRVGFTTPLFHSVYVSLFALREQADETELKKDTVGLDCSVRVKIGNEQQIFTILDDPTLFQDRGEISVSLAHEMQIFGKKKDDSFTLRKGPFGKEVVCTIVEVQSKYVRAFQETFERFRTLFPTDTSLQGIEGPFESFRDDLLKDLDQRQNQFNQIARLYESRQITYEGVATLLGCSPLELWGYLISGRYCVLVNFSGTSEEMAIESPLTAASEEIILEFTAILTFAQIGLLDRLAKRYKLSTTQAVRDSFTQALAKVTLSKPGLSIGKVGDTYVREETTIESLSAQKAFLERVVHFLKESVSELAVPSLLETHAELDDVREFIGPIATSSILAARDSGLPLFTDDQMLRSLIRNEWKLATFSTQPLLNELMVKGIISKEEYVAAISMLFVMNFSVVMINVENVMWILEKVQYRLTNEVNKLLAAFHAPQCLLESAIGILSEATRRIWISDTLSHKRADLLNAILDSLGTNRPTRQVAEYFMASIRIKLYLAPTAFDEISKLVGLWQERQLNGKSIIVPAFFRQE